jgi:hypothetical protein
MRNNAISMVKTCHNHKGPQRWYAREGRPGLAGNDLPRLSAPSGNVYFDGDEAIEFMTKLSVERDEDDAGAARNVLLEHLAAPFMLL